MVQPTESAAPDDKKLEKVITNEVIRRKQPLTKRLAQTFFGGSAKSAAQYVMMEVLLPAAKDAVADAFSQGVERIIFGETRSASRRGGFRGVNLVPNNFTAYNRITSPSGVAPYQPNNTLSPQARAHHNFDEIILATRPEALAVITRLQGLITTYGSCTVADMYAIMEITSEYTDNKYGWTSLQGADIVRIREGYLLDLPRPVQLS
jgi:hypothetical protein